MTDINNIKFISVEDYQKWCDEHNHRGIGGSDVAGIINKSNWASPFSVWKDRLYGRDSFKTNYMIDGINLEDGLLNQFLEENPEFELADKCDNKLAIHPEYEFMVAAIDAIVRHKDTKELYILEIKTTNAFNKDKWEGGIPEYYYTQVLHYANCTGIDKAILYVSIRDGVDEESNKAYLLTEESSPSYEETKTYLMKEILNFWNKYILTRTPPLIDGSDATEKALNYLNEHEIDLSSSFITMKEEIPSILEARDYYDKLIKEMSSIKKELDNIIKGFVGFGKKEIGDYKVSYNTYTSNKFNSTRFREDNEDLYNQYLDQSSYQRMIITKKKKKEEE